MCLSSPGLFWKLPCVAHVTAPSSPDTSAHYLGSFFEHLGEARGLGDVQRHVCDSGVRDTETSDAHTTGKKTGGGEEGGGYPQHPANQT